MSSPFLIAHRVRTAPTTPQQYLRSLKWDGRSRLSHWLFNAMDTRTFDSMSRLKRKVVSAVGQQFLMAMAMRALAPGCPFEKVLVLVGPQGTGKTRLLQTLGGPFFANIHADFWVEQPNVWLYEFTELDTLAPNELDGLKAFASQQADAVRAPYSPTAVKATERAFVVAATTNDANLLVGVSTKMHRFWLVEVNGNIDIAYVARNRDQLFAEAVARVKNGEQYREIET